jgi:hypothetical protein
LLIFFCFIFRYQRFGFGTDFDCGHRSPQPVNKVCSVVAEERFQSADHFLGAFVIRQHHHDIFRQHIVSV